MVGYGSTSTSRRSLDRDRPAPTAAPSAPEGRTASDRQSGCADRHPVRDALGSPLGDAAGRDGLRLRHELLATPAQLARGRRMEATASVAAEAPARSRRDRLATGEPGQCLRPGQKRGPATGPNPTDRGKPGTKRHLVTDARGTPLGLRLTEANRHDSPQMAPTLDAIPPLSSGRPGRPRRRPDKLHADKAYDAKARRQECRARGIVPRIARKGIESSQKLGLHRWVVDPSTGSR